MTIAAFLSSVRTITVQGPRRPVHQTVAKELSARYGASVRLSVGAQKPSQPGELRIGSSESDAGGPGTSNAPARSASPPGDPGRAWCTVRFAETGSGEIVASHDHFLFSMLAYLADYEGERDVADTLSGALDLKDGFQWNRPVYDSLLTQLQRTARGFDWRSQIRAYAEAGFSHVEVNALSAGQGMEASVPGEVYPVFYTYGAALDQFTASRLNRGCYPSEYLASNMALLKRYAQEALRYGMRPGMLCFEPRNAPEALLDRYPMLRGARVDHPFRSFRPRYSLALSHPAVRMHYRELLQNIMREVPEIDYITILTNDSGAGFEFTRSLYVGANGGPYLIREWKSVEDVAKTAAANAVSFFRLLRDAGREINPRFRLFTRLEPFGVERPYLLDGLEEGIDIEGSSFEHQGYGFSYHHDLYDDVAMVQSTIWHNRFRKSERSFIDKMNGKGVRCHVYYTFDGFQNFDPLLAIPAPWMVAEKLQELKRAGCREVANLAGITPSSLAPWDVNREIVRLAGHQDDLDVDSAISRIARRWVGEKLSQQLAALWRKAQESIRAYPPAGLYTSWGMAWYRLWIRPLVPDIDAIPESERAYYERFLLATPHNPNRIDLNADILFELGGPELAGKNVERIDAKVLPPLLETIDDVRRLLAELPDSGKSLPFHDLYDRLRGLKCWFVTHRNVQAWIAGVHGYLRSNDESIRRAKREYLERMIDSEIDNTEELITLFEEAGSCFMAISDLGESVHLHGDSFPDHLRRKIDLMRRYRDREPRVDPNYMFRVPGLDSYSLDEMSPGVTPVVGEIEEV